MNNVVVIYRNQFIMNSNFQFFQRVIFVYQHPPGKTKENFSSQKTSERRKLKYHLQWLEYVFLRIFETHKH